MSAMRFFRLVVLHARARLLRSHPYRIAAGMVGSRRSLAEDAPIGDLAETVDVAIGRAARRAGADRHAVLRQLGQAIAKPRIEIFVDHLGRRLDMSVGIPDLEPVFHHPLSRSSLCDDLYTTQYGMATASEKCSTPRCDWVRSAD